jgi:hypothetical protein
VSEHDLDLLVHQGLLDGQRGEEAHNRRRQITEWKVE